ncbi:hypothetical protein V496_08114 [Pseudogymnoascus sp. VKM F-4515 (FW-2607)]|nr:hypothetical protein V496_08114 [Pseudogymnoascus sp. VKM F-4515 (FW-2607)]KFY95200.1 hypothetical protein V498_03498 [Pseudogymnoascus sp. VKM F-4517 (FW-2822)]
MAEPPYKRSRRDFDSDRPAVDSRNSRDRRGGRQEPDRGNDRNRSYRSRTPERTRDRDYDRDSQRYDRGGGRRDDRRDRDGGRTDGLRDDPRRDDRGRHGQRDMDRDGDRRQYRDDRGARDNDRGQRDRRRDGEGDSKRRSRSPRGERSREREPAADAANPNMARIVEQDMPLRQGSRHATPPVAFKVGRPDSRAGSRDPGGQSPAQADAAATNASTSHKNKPKASDFIAADDMDVEEGEDDDIEVEDDAMAAMQAMMGFGGFGTTKQKKVLGNDIGGIRKEKKTEYRQYMNRVGGFNRPLSPSRET